MIFQYQGRPLPKPEKISNKYGLAPKIQLANQKQNTTTTDNINDYDWNSFKLNELDIIKLTLTRKYSQFTGRTSRNEFLRFFLMITLFMSIFFIIVNSIIYHIDKFIAPIALLILFCIVNILLFIPILAITIRRLHDINKSSWYILLNIIPIIGTILFIKLLLKNGDTQPNKYGDITSHILITKDIKKYYRLKSSASFTSTIIYSSICILLIIFLISDMVPTLTTYFSHYKVINTTFTTTQNETKESQANSTKTKSDKTTEKNNSINAKSIQEKNPVEESTKVLKDYYNYINSKDFAKAYIYLSNKQQSNIGSLTDWSNGYKNTTSIKLLYANPTYISQTQVNYEYRLESKDLIQGQIKHQIFAGTIIMIKENNQDWKIDNQDGKLLSSNIE